MNEENKVHSQDLEGIKIERERKYLINNQELYNLICQNLPEKIVIPIPTILENQINQNMLELLNEIFSNEMKSPDGDFFLKAHIKNGVRQIIQKHRPNYYFDSIDNILFKNNILFNLRQRENDWVVNIKVRTKEIQEQGYQKGIFERIEFTSIIANDIIEQAKTKGDINIHAIIDKSPILQENFNLKIKQFLKDNLLQLKHFFIVDSFSSLYPISPEKGMFLVTVDKIIFNRENQQLAQFELEIKFNPTKTWFDTVSMRVFNYLTQMIIVAIKNQLKTSLSVQELDDLFNEITYLSKLERINNVILREV